MSVTEVIKYHSKRLVAILTEELKLEEGHLKDRLHARTLEQIFVEERIYKKIEQMKTQETVIKAVLDGFKPFAAQIKRPVTVEDVEKLLKIPIRRISLYDINKAKKEMEEIRGRLKEIKHHLANIVDYAVGFVGDLIKDNKALYPRKTALEKFRKVDVREAAQRNFTLRYDSDTGYLGYEVSGGTALFDVSDLDRVLVIRKTGAYSVIKVPDKLFVDKGMLFCSLADKDELGKLIFSVIYRQQETGYPYIKRCRIEQYILERGYSLVPEKSSVLALTTETDGEAVVTYAPKPRVRVLEERFGIKGYPLKGLKAAGIRLSTRESVSAVFEPRRKKAKKAD